MMSNARNRSFAGANLNAEERSEQEGIVRGRRGRGGICLSFFDCMGALGKCCDGLLKCLTDCWEGYKNGNANCWNQTRIVDRLNPRFTVASKKFSSFLVKGRLICFITSLCIWIPGCILAIRNYEAHCMRDTGSTIPCEGIPRRLLMSGLIAPPVVNFVFFLTFLIQMCTTPAKSIPVGGPLLVSDHLAWDIIIPLFSFFISTSVAQCAPKSIGAAYHWSGLFVLACALFEVAATLSPRTGLVSTSAGIAIAISTPIAIDHTIDDHELAIGAIVFTCVIVIVSAYIHKVIGRLLTASANPEINPVDQGVNKRLLSPPANPEIGNTDGTNTVDELTLEDYDE